MERGKKSAKSSLAIRGVSSFGACTSFALRCWPSRFFRVLWIDSCRGLVARSIDIGGSRFRSASIVAGFACRIDGIATRSWTGLRTSGRRLSLRLSAGSLVRSSKRKILRFFAFSIPQRDDDKKETSLSLFKRKDVHATKTF